MALRADDYAACINSLGLEEGWIGIAVDTCHDWPSLYWGVMRSGHNALRSVFRTKKMYAQMGFYDIMR